MLAGGYPVLLCVWVNLEDVGTSAEDGLFPGGKKENGRLKADNFIPPNSRT